jgi:dsDNA-specific endonuclease/ATPase MutS2
MTTDQYESNGDLEEIIGKLEEVRDSMEEVLKELEEVEERQHFYRTDAPYGLPLDEDNGNGD